MTARAPKIVSRACHRLVFLMPSFRFKVLWGPRDCAERTTSDPSLSLRSGQDDSGGGGFLSCERQWERITGYRRVTK